ncbi:MAG: hypothetical protein M3408_08790 [Actinomycetota bacterium]|jgi:predicted 3-demethylubiquinone-9 3-methyltransferase (glyoxalase superfamily)|nr:hypothetical protein [Pseudonocardiales bacterium]MDQ3601327.1 hypothetical protein [Actinomycetota bacterium]
MAGAFTTNVENLRLLATDDLGVLWDRLSAATTAIAGHRYIGGDRGAEEASGWVAGTYGSVWQDLLRRQEEVLPALGETRQALLEIAEVYAIADGQS